MGFCYFINTLVEKRFDAILLYFTILIKVNLYFHLYIEGLLYNKHCSKYWNSMENMPCNIIYANRGRQTIGK